jgi:uncharacterized Zn finger protein
MSSQLHHYTHCPFCTASVKPEVLEELGVDKDMGKGPRPVVTVTCPDCGAEIKFKLHWEVSSAEVVFAGRSVLA